jgi:hypothetical protein
MIDNWESTPAGVARRAAGVAPAPVLAPLPDGMVAGPVEPVTPADIESRRADHEVFERAWSDVLATQRQIIRDGWQGCFIDHPDTRQPWQKAMDASALAAQAIVETAGPGETLSTERDAAERFRRAQQRQDVAGAT